MGFGCRFAGCTNWHRAHCHLLFQSISKLCSAYKLHRDSSVDRNHLFGNTAFVRIVSSAVTKSCRACSEVGNFLAQLRVGENSSATRRGVFYQH